MSVHATNLARSVRVSVVTRRTEFALGDVPVTVPASPLVLSVSGTNSRTVKVDGLDYRIVHGVVAIDLTRSTGYHRVEVDACIFWFATEDRKLGLSGITRMLDELAGQGTSWGGQALFSDGSGYIDPHVVYGWFDAHANSAFDAIESILQSPHSEAVTEHIVGRRGGGSVRAAHTIRMIRRDPSRNAIEHEEGVIHVGTKRYNPTRVVTRKRHQTIDTVANRRAAQFIPILSALLEKVINSNVPGPIKGRCRNWRERVDRLMQHAVAVKLIQGQPSISSPRAEIEYSNRSYALNFQFVQTVSSLGWAVAPQHSLKYSYIESADQVYQAYVACRFASALSLAASPGGLRANSLAFENETFELYYDSIIPKNVAPTWRSESIAPDQSRPDLLLREKASGKIAIIDAKYRVGKDGYASEDSRKEVEAYQSLYGLNSVTIAYPGTGMETRIVEGFEKTIVELPVFGEGDNLDNSVAQVLSRMQSPAFLFQPQV